MYVSYLFVEVNDSVVVHGEVEEARRPGQSKVGPGFVGRLRVGDHLLSGEPIATDCDGQVCPPSLRRDLFRQPYKLCFLILRQGDGLAIGTSQDD